jgi:hypothetical protein
MKVLNLKAKKCKGKYKSYKGEVGKTCNNSLLDNIEKLKGLSPCSYRQQSLNQLILN